LSTRVTEVQYSHALKIEVPLYFWLQCCTGNRSGLSSMVV